MCTVLYVAMLVIGAGLSRTGTLSTKAALERLLGSPCYHGSTPLVDMHRQDHIAFWAEAMDQGRLDQDKTRDALAGYKAGLDLPIAAWYKELMKIYPESKVILTVRDPRPWYRSICLIMENMICMTYDWPYSWFTCLGGSRALCSYYQRVSGGIHPGKGDLPPGLQGRLNKAIREGEEAAVEFFRSHTADVKSHVPEDRLLVFDVKDGWEPLCNFLDVPVPDHPFPNTNKYKEQVFQFSSTKAVVWVSLLLLCSLLLSTLVFTPDPSTLAMYLGLVVALLLVTVRLLLLAATITSRKAKTL